jgi:hypothetical protein
MTRLLSPEQRAALEQALAMPDHAYGRRGAVCRAVESVTEKSPYARARWLLAADDRCAAAVGAARMQGLRDAATTLRQLGECSDIDDNGAFAFAYDHVSGMAKEAER